MEEYFNSDYYHETNHDSIVISVLSEEVKQLRFNLKEMTRINNINLANIRILEAKNNKQ